MRESIMNTLLSTGDCCEDFLDEIQTRFGDSLDVLVEKLAQHLANVVCAERTFTNMAGASTKERCGYSIVNSYTFINQEHGYEAPSLLNLAQIPNDQMCSAFAGQDFTNTKGELVSLGFGSYGADTMGICLQPLDALTQYFASWPLFSETINADGVDLTLTDLFTPDTFVSGELLLSYLTTPTNLPAIFLQVAASLQAFMYVDDDAGSAEVVDTFDTDNSVDWYDFNPDSSANWGSWGWSYADNSESSEGPQSERDDGSAGWGYTDTSAGSDSSNIFDELLALAVHVPVNGNCTYSDQSIVIPFPMDNA